MIQTNKEKQVLESKAQKLQKQLEKIKNAPKPVMIDLSSKCEMSKQEVNLRSEVESLTKENEKLDE